jgi:hypothetical protein
MIDFLDKKAELSTLSPNEKDTLRCLKDRISHLLREVCLTPKFGNFIAYMEFTNGSRQFGEYL